MNRFDYDTTTGGTLMKHHLTAVISREGDGFVALCPELDVASQGYSIEQARDNLKEAVELFFECASPAEVEHGLSGETYITHLEVTVG
jgi:predicted RNase H-like HicB family nuclease